MFPRAVHAKPPAFLRRRSSLPMWADLAWRVLLIIALVSSVLIVHWIERDGLKDNLDNQISFIDVLYFTTFTVTTIRIFVWLIFLGTAYHFVFRNVWHRWRMSRIQKTLTGHVVVAGFGTSGAEAVRELIAREIDPAQIVVIDQSDEALALAEACGCNVLKGDA